MKPAGWRCVGRSSTVSSAACRGASRRAPTALSTDTTPTSTAAFGVPGLGLRRGLGDDLVVAPYATALATMIDPGAATENLQRLAAQGLDGPYGYYEAIDYTSREADGSDGHTHKPSEGTVVRTWMAHHQGMTLVAIANTLLDHPLVEYFHADPRIKATELLLQERLPRQVPVAQPRPIEATHVATAVGVDAVRRFRSPAMEFPHAAFLSNGAYVAVVTNSGAGMSLCRGRSVTRGRRDATRDPGAHFIYLRDVRTGAVWSATAQPFGGAPREYLATLSGGACPLPSRGPRHRHQSRHRGVHRRRRRGAEGVDHEPQ